MMLCEWLWCQWTTKDKRQHRDTNVIDDTHMCVNELHIAADFSILFTFLLSISVWMCVSYELFRLCRFRYSNVLKAMKKTATWHNPFGMCEYYNRMICYAIFCQWACACVCLRPYLFEAIDFRPSLSSRLRTSAHQAPAHSFAHLFIPIAVDRSIGFLLCFPIP